MKKFSDNTVEDFKIITLSEKIDRALIDSAKEKINESASVDLSSKPSKLKENLENIIEKEVNDRVLKILEQVDKQWNKNYSHKEISEILNTYKKKK